MIRYAAVLLCAAAVSPAATIALYDGSLNTNPAVQGWTLLALGGLGGSYSESVAGGATIMTTAGPQRAGYSMLSPLPLDSNAGYRFNIELQLDSEWHSYQDRAGLSLVLIGSDLRGLEIGFWTDEVWVQNDSPIFTHGEGAPFDTTQRTLYTLTVLGSGYSLSAGNTALSSGALRNYSAAGLPYTAPGFVFVGDDTFSANATARFFQANVAELPEPAAWPLAGAGLLAILWSRRRRPSRANRQ